MTNGEKIRNARLKKGMTQRELGEACIPPIAESTIRRYELGKLNPKLGTLRKIANALQVPLYVVADFTQYSSDELREDFQHATLVNINVGDKTFTDSDSYQEYIFKQTLDNNFHNLNKNGQRRLTEYSIDLTKIPEYQKKPAAQILNAAHDNGATEEQKAHADKIMDDDSEWE